jgi:CrcB protein
MSRVTVLLVAIAGAGGVLLRYGISSGFHGDALPWATVAINVVGSFLLGLVVVAHWASPETRTALGVGFLGGFTTFSTFSVQAILDVDAGEPMRALVYVLASVLLGIAAAAAGYYLGRAVQ